MCTSDDQPAAKHYPAMQPPQSMLGNQPASHYIRTATSRRVKTQRLPTFHPPHHTVGCQLPQSQRLAVGKPSIHPSIPAKPSIHPSIHPSLQDGIHSRAIRHIKCIEGLCTLELRHHSKDQRSMCLTYLGSCSSQFCFDPSTQTQILLQTTPSVVPRFTITNATPPRYPCQESPLWLLNTHILKQQHQRPYCHTQPSTFNAVAIAYLTVGGVGLPTCLTVLGHMTTTPAAAKGSRNTLFQFNNPSSQ
jgi:hypothetical protein